MRLLKALALAGLLAILPTAMWNCFKVPPSPVMPTWDTQLSIPLVDTVYYLKDVLSNNSDITIQDSIYVFKPQPHVFAPVSLGSGDRLTLNPPITDTVITKRIGALRIPPPPPLEYSSPITAFYPFVPADHDTTLTPPPTFIPGFTFNASPTLPFADTTFDYVRLHGGTMIMTVINGLPTTVHGTITLTNKFSELIGTFPLGTINPVDSVSSPAPLDGIRLTDSVGFGIQIQVDNINLPATFRHDAIVAVRITVSDTSADGQLSISEAKLKIPSINVQPDTTFTQLLLDKLPPTYVRQVLFGGGGITFSVNNQIDAGIILLLKFKELHRNSDDSVFILNQTISPLTNQPPTTVAFDTTPGGYKFESAGPSDDSLRVGLAITTLNLNQFAVIHETDSMSLSMHFITPFRIKQVAGRLRPTTVDFTNERIAFPKTTLGGNFRALAVKLPADTLLKLSIQTAAGHAIDFYNFRIRGFASGGGTIGTLSLPQTPHPGVAPAWRFQPNQLNEIGFTGSDLNAFLNNFPNGQPDSMAFEGDSVSVDPWDLYNNPATVGTVSDTMGIYASANFMIPFKIEVDSGSFTDTVQLGGHRNNGGSPDSSNNSNKPIIDKGLLSHFTQGAFTFITSNTIPIHIGLRPYFLQADSTGRDSLLLPPDSLGVDISPGMNQVHYLVIRQDQAEKFNNADKVAIKLLMDTQNAVAAFDSTQYIRIRLLANIKFNVNTNK